MNKKEETNLSRFISLILRHKPETIGIELDEHGWADVKELLDGINYTGKNISYSDLQYIVKNDSKTRYSFNKDCTKIRANQGHSINVDVGLEEKTPPDVLYHGTGEKYIDSIILNGLEHKSRLYVHLSENKNTAENVGARHGVPRVFAVNCQQMVSDGFIFRISKNGVWMSDDIPSEYLTLLPPQ